MKHFADHRYLLSTDGWISGGKLSQLLAMGSVVLKPKSKYRMYYEWLLQPSTHFVPLWESHLFDVVDLLRNLESEPVRAARIARTGQELACSVLTRKGRAQFWSALIKQLRRLHAYNVDSRHLEWRLKCDFLSLNQRDGRNASTLSGNVANDLVRSVRRTFCYELTPRSHGRAGSRSQHQHACRNIPGT